VRTDRNYYSALDGIRGLAIVLVVICHFHDFYLVEMIPQARWETLWLQLADFTWVGVDLFFALSGFLITGILLRTRTQEGYFKNFYMRRFFRIFPLYYGFLFLYFKVAPHFVDLAHTPGSGYSSVLEHQVWYWTYIANFLMARSGQFLSEMSHFWSLSVEEHFYILWPLMIYLLGNRALLKISALPLELRRVTKPSVLPL